MRFCSLKTLPSSLRQGRSFHSIIVLSIRALDMLTATCPYSIHYIVPTSAYLRHCSFFVTRLKRTPFGLTTPEHQYGGEKENEQVWTCERHHEKVLVRVQNYRTAAEEQSGMQQAVANSNLSAILASFEIKALNKEGTGVLIDVTRFYTSDIPATGTYSVDILEYLKTSLKASSSLQTANICGKRLMPKIPRSMRICQISNQRSVLN